MLKLPRLSSRGLRTNVEASPQGRGATSRRVAFLKAIIAGT